MTAERAAKGTAAEYVRLDRQGTRPGPHLGPHPGPRLGPRAVALVPGAGVPLIALDLPAGLGGQAREDVARRQLKDRLGLGPEALVMRPFTLDGKEDAWRRALVADPALLAAWQDLPCRAVLPDYLALPAAEGVWTLAVEDGDLLARLGPDDGFSAALPLAPAMLRAALEAGRPGAVLRLGGPADAVDALLSGAGLTVARRAEEIAEAGLPMPRRLAHGELAMDLRRDPQAARARLRRRLRPWRWPYLFAACAAGLWAAAQILAIRDTEARIATLDAAARAMTAEHFVPRGPILDIRAQVSRALDEARRAVPGETAESDPLELFGRAAEVIAASAGATTQQASFTREGGLVLILRLPDFAAADQLAAALEAEGLAVTRGDTRISEASAGVRAELRLAAAGGTARP